QSLTDSRVGGRSSSDARIGARTSSRIPAQRPSRKARSLPTSKVTCTIYYNTSPDQFSTGPSAKVFAHLRRAGATGAAEPGKAPGILDRPKQAVVGLLHRGLKSGPCQGRDHQGGDPAASGIRAASGVGAALVPGDEQNHVAAVG